MTWLFIIGGLLLLAVIIFAVISRKSATDDPDNGDGWIIITPLSAFPVQQAASAAAPVVTVSWDRSISQLKVGDVAVATVFLNGKPAPVSTKCQWAVSTTGLVSIAQSTTQPGLNRITALKPGSLRMIALAGGSLSLVMFATIKAVAPPPPPPPPLPKITIEPAMAAMTVGDELSFEAKRDGKLALTDIDWNLTGPATGQLDPLLGFIVKATGTGLITIRATDHASPSASASLSFKIAAPAIPTAPALLWKRLRPHITLMSTDFYYNWTKAMYAVYAKLYDVVISGAAANIAAVKAINPDQHRLPYALLLTTIIDAPTGALADVRAAEFLLGGSNADHGMIEHFLAAHHEWTAQSFDEGPLGGTYAAELSTLEQRIAAAASAGNIQTKYLDDFNAWCAANSISTADAEAAWLHDASGKRIIPHIWDSPRNVPDPTNAVARRYAVDRLTRIAKSTNADGVFLDEFGSGGVSPIFALTGQPTAPYMAAVVTLLSEIQTALSKLSPPKQLIVNSASYTFPWDNACCVAALGTHMEQTNNPLSGNLVSGIKASGSFDPTWGFTDKLLALDVFVNMVPPYQFGEYESQVGKAGTQHMDTVRGKLLELASYYMVVTNPALLGLSIENGDWAKYTPVQNFVPAIEAEIGYQIEARNKAVVSKGPTGHCWQRRFSNGLVLFNPIWNDLWNRASQDFGPTNAISVALPEDRKYFHVDPTTGKVDSIPTTSIVLRTPEAAIFVCA